MSSYAKSFFDGDWRRAYEFNPVPLRYVPAIANFLRDTSVPKVHVVYEQLVSRPEAELERIFNHLGLKHDPGAVEYGTRFAKQEGMGDPITVDTQNRPVTTSIAAWQRGIQGNADAQGVAQQIVDRLSADDVRLWGFDLPAIQDELSRIMSETQANGGSLPAKRRTKLNSYTFKRKVLLTLRKDIHKRPLGRIVKRVRYYCDVILRDSL